MDNNNGNNNINNNGPESLVQEWGKILVRTLVPDLIPGILHSECHANTCQETVEKLEKLKKRPVVDEVEEICTKVTIGRQYKTKELIPVAGSSLTHPQAARINKMLTAALKIAKKISKEDIERLTTGTIDDVFMVSLNKREFYASTMGTTGPLKLSSNLLQCNEIIVCLKDGSQMQVVSTSHKFWNDNTEKIICLIPVLKLPIRLPYVITHNGRYFTMKLDEINLERFCQERNDNIILL